LFELQAEAAVSQLRSFSLPDKAGRRDLALKDSISGGAKTTGRIQDTHFVGSAQFEYCRVMAKTAGIYDESIEKYISTNKVGWKRNMCVKTVFERESN
jgi:hypothetical protein